MPALVRANRELQHPLCGLDSTGQTNAVTAPGQLAVPALTKWLPHSRPSVGRCQYPLLRWLITNDYYAMCVLELFKPKAPMTPGAPKRVEIPLGSSERIGLRRTPAFPVFQRNAVSVELHLHRFFNPHAITTGHDKGHGNAAGKAPIKHPPVARL